MSWRLKDTATSAFAGLIELRDLAANNLVSRAATDWLARERFDDLGAAMGLYGRMRELLERGGLELEVNDWRRIPSTHPRWRRLVEMEDLLPPERLHGARMLLYLGFHDAARAMVASLHPSTDAEVRLAVCWIASLADAQQQPHAASTAALEAILDASDAGSPSLRFLATSTVASLAARRGGAGGAQWLNRARDAAAEIADPIARFVADARIARFEAAARGGGVDEIIDTLTAALDGELADGDRFSIAETLRRICDYATLRALSRREPALRSARVATTVDPTCARAWLLRGEAALTAGERAEAQSAFRRARVLGVIERPHALRRLEQLESSSLHDEIAILANETDWSFADRGPDVLPVGVDAVERLLSVSAGNPGWNEYLQRSVAYRRFLPFWELRMPEVETTFSALAPVVAWSAARARKNPFFRHLHLQRAKVPNFRQELVFAGVANVSLAQQSLDAASSLDAVRGRSAEMDAFLSRVDAIEDESLIDRCLLSSVLTSLAFHEEARRASSFVLPEGRLTPEEQYALFAQFTIEDYCERNIGRARPARAYTPLVHAMYGRLTDEEETLRIRLLICMQAAVHHGQESVVDEVRRWRETGEAVLRKIEASARFDGFEKAILTSRFYRAVSYLPFLTRDRDLLTADAAICERAARTAPARDEHEELIRMENLYPALESLSRIHAFLGDRERAFSLMTEMVASVDPFDSKAWIQIGELEQKRGRLQEAADAFVRAGTLGPPASRIAWFRAGSVLEQLGELDRARDAFLSSLRHWPQGISPLMRLWELAPRLGEPALRAWAAEALSALRVENRLGEKQASRIDELLARAS